MGWPCPAAAATSGVEFFRAGDHAAALSAFRSELGGSLKVRRGLIQFNIASCLFELGRFDEAEATFGQEVPSDHRLYGLAMVNAGYSALEQQAPMRARAFLDRARSGDPGGRWGARIKGLADDLTKAGDAKARSLLRQGVEALEAGDLEAANRAYDAAGIWAADPALRAEAHFGAGTTLLRRGQRDGALGRFRQASELLPGDSEYRRTLAEMTSSNAAPLSVGSAPGASASSSDLGSSWDLAGWVSAGGGWDSNVGMSAGADHEGLFVGDDGGGPTADALVTIEGRLFAAGTFGFRWAYVFDELAFLQEEHQEYSVQRHRLELRVERALGGAWDLETWVFGAWKGLGLTAPETLMTRTGGAVRARGRLGNRWVMTLAGEIAAAEATTDWDYLTGMRYELRAKQRFSIGAHRLTLKLRGRREDVGISEIGLDSESLAACDLSCEGAMYIIPYGYDAGSARLLWAWRLLPWLSFNLGVDLEHRQYAGESFVRAADDTVIAASQKQRVDQRWGASGELVAAVGSGWWLSLRYEGVQNGSTMASDSADADHQWDYANRDYDQQLATLRIEKSF